MKRLFTVAVVGSLSSALLAGAAEAKPGTFALVKTFKLAGDETVTAAIAPTRRSAFVFGMRERRAGLEPLAFRWNGRTWSRSPLPGGLTGIPGQADASSAKNVWMSVTGSERLAEKYLDNLPEDGCAAPQRSAGPRTAPAAARAGSNASKVLRWNGKRWTVARTFKNAYVNAVAALGPKNVWVYGLDRKGPASWHFDGRTWKRHATGFLIQKAEAVSGREIWALAHDRSLHNGYSGIIARFDGTRWTRVQPDVLRTDPAPTKTSPGYSATILDLNVLGRDRVWVSAITTEGALCGANVHASVQLRWNGRTWASEAPAVTSGFILSDHVSDGSGGLYAQGWGSDSGDEWDFDRAFFHRTPKGVWTRRILPERRMIQHLVHIPGTKSLWAAGTRETSGGGIDVAVWSLGRP
ncbi:hypothetical protein ABGB12_04775 [Actinocorallia sp. B10E7]|uniref:hypothetical protein n=1 Tax=Actinocorallia sp. B10E7 TaxID=3153558 RepID=UPI00325CA0B6